MAEKAVIPVEAVRDQVVAIDRRLAELKRDSDRIKSEEATLAMRRSILEQIEHLAVVPTPVAPLDLRKGRKDSKPVDPPGDHLAAPGGAIPDGKVATPVILQMIREKPGITSVQIMDAIESRVTKTGPKGGRKFLADLIWELGHRNKLVRAADGGLSLPTEGGGS